jgi:hypothetical protein
MQHHRFREQLGFVEGPTQMACASSVGSFLVCPAVLQLGWTEQTCPWRQIYQMAYERARAVVAPSRLERLLIASPN